MIFRKTIGDAQLDDEVTFVKNFGWAPQRFNSRARPLARERRRWKSIFDAVALEAASADKNQRVLARMYLESSEASIVRGRTIIMTMNDIRK